MHKCAKCGREAASLEEIDAGCPCGSKVFTFDRQAAQAAANEAAPESPLEGDGKADEMANAGKVPGSYFARTTFTDEDIENIKVLTQGVFLLDVNAIANDPVVLKDEDEIYYVKLPLEQKVAPTAQASGEGNGKEQASGQG